MNADAKKLVSDAKKIAPLLPAKPAKKVAKKVAKKAAKKAGPKGFMTLTAAPPTGRPENPADAIKRIMRLTGKSEQECKDRLIMAGYSRVLALANYARG